uniref:Uncharacterized protein n=1 Tax=Nelumbo nucifera TaxID=4432 RepID=A0A822ZR04_NELNU|nr:TPA_asm: hypothetical protein HUJ06_017230 [Nelumbo nucifera]
MAFFSNNCFVYEQFHGTVILWDFVHEGWANHLVATELEFLNTGQVTLCQSV